MPLPADPTSRKEIPLARGFLDYFPDAAAEVAHLSYVGNQQHNPGEDLHWARDKSDDHADCAVRHLIDRGERDTDGMRHTAKLAWRALALLQLEIEADRGKGPTPARGNTAPVGSPTTTNTGTSPPATPLESSFVAASGDFPIPAEDRYRDLLRVGLVAKGCVPEVADVIVAGLTPPSELSPLRDVKPVTYVAGPMRGYPHFNFSSFDRARDILVDHGVFVISPADIDRAADDGELEGEASTSSREQTLRFMYRDFFAIRLLNPTHGDFLTVLPNWEKSTGACAEVMLARWLGVPIHKMVFGQDPFLLQPLMEKDVDYSSFKEGFDAYLNRGPLGCDG